MKLQKVYFAILHERAAPPFKVPSIIKFSGNDLKNFSPLCGNFGAPKLERKGTFNFNTAHTAINANLTGNRMVRALELQICLLSNSF